MPSVRFWLHVQILSTGLSPLSRSPATTCVLYSTRELYLVSCPLLAGIPSVPCPVMLDQPFLAARLVEAGVACKPLPFHKMSAQVNCADNITIHNRYVS